MSDRFTVAIVGRPNVGKSALFNRMVRATSSIVHSQSGVTRDRLYGTVQWQGEEFTLLDTGGLDFSSDEDLVKNIRLQVEQALVEADALIFVVDLRSGLTPEDIEVAEVLRKTNKPLLLAANKADTGSHDLKAADFYELGFEDVYPVSAAHGLGVGDLLDRLLEIMGGDRSEERDPRRTGGPANAGAKAGAEAGVKVGVEAGAETGAKAGVKVGVEVRGDARRKGGDDGEESEGPLIVGAAIRVAIVGKPNVGKSSLVNALLGDKRMTVSTVPGTTVDAVDTPFRWGDRDFVLIDTAGLRRPKVIGEKLEELSVGRALSAIKRSDVVILVLDGTQRPSSQDRRIAGYIRRSGKASLIVVNKTDLGLWGDVSKEQYGAAALYECRPVDYSEVLFISALTGVGIRRILPWVVKVYGEYGKRIDTALLNQAVTEITTMAPPPKEARFYYATQVGQNPPHMVFFVRNPSKVSTMYERYLDSEIRKRFGFQGTPIVMEFKERQRKRRT
ncbi:MAG: ribosome biogenesis GTPase Der [Bacillota bacterium]|jgi:GTP-binding protein|nr:ribosome biogenesis GTPase Der [Candidatus Fermentithermobacillaceae bacterium]